MGLAFGNNKHLVWMLYAFKSTKDEEINYLKREIYDQCGYTALLNNKKQS